MTVHEDDDIHICDECGNVKYFPKCMPINVQFGNGSGNGFRNGNIIHCKNHSVVDIIGKMKGEVVTGLEQVQAHEDELENTFQKSLLEWNDFQSKINP